MPACHQASCLFFILFLAFPLSVQASYVSDIYIFCEAVQPAEPGSFIKERKVHLEKEENIADFFWIASKLPVTPLNTTQIVQLIRN